MAYGTTNKKCAPLSCPSVPFFMGLGFWIIGAGLLIPGAVLMARGCPHSDDNAEYGVAPPPPPPQPLSDPPGGSSRRVLLFSPSSHYTHGHYYMNNRRRRESRGGESVPTCKSLPIFLIVLGGSLNLTGMIVFLVYWPPCKCNIKPHQSEEDKLHNHHNYQQQQTIMLPPLVTGKRF